MVVPYIGSSMFSLFGKSAMIEKLKTERFKTGKKFPRNFVEKQS